MVQFPAKTSRRACAGGVQSSRCFEIRSVRLTHDTSLQISTLIPGRLHTPAHTCTCACVCTPERTEASATHRREPVPNSMETEKLSSSSSKHMSLPEVGVFLTPPSTPAVKQEPAAGGAGDCSRGEDGLVPVPAHQPPCRLGKPCHHGSTGPPPESLEYHRDGCAHDPGYEAPGAMLPEQYYSGPPGASPAGDTLTLPDQRPLTPRYDNTTTTEEPNFETTDTQPAHNLSPDTQDATQMEVYEVYSNGDFRPWDQTGNTAGSVGTTGAFGNYHGSNMSPMSTDSASPVQSPPCTAVPCYPPGQRRSTPRTRPCPTPRYSPHPGVVLRPGTVPSPLLLPPCLHGPIPAANSPPSVPSPQGNLPAHFPRDSGSPDPGQTFDFPAPFAVPHHEASPGAALRHHREAMGIPPPPVTGPKPPPPHPGDLSEQQLDRFLRQTRREFSDLLSGPDEPPPVPAAERRLPAVSHHHLPGLDRPPSPPRNHHLPGLDRPPSPPRQQPGLTDRDLEEVQTLIMQEVSRDIEVAFKVVQVPRDPRTWSPTDVARWLRWTADQYRLPNVYLECFPLDGAQLCDLAEREFVYRAPESGQILYALLDIWKSGITNVSFPNPYMPNCAPYPALQDTSPPQTEKAQYYVDKLFVKSVGGSSQKRAAANTVSDQCIYGSFCASFSPSLKPTAGLYAGWTEEKALSYH
ncbi:hypothetical protein Bbelb_231050 [Branchiostoma belcheri]|nr:hypothetical protein Bbelb_231050 [Branchiostoma belcheri]